MTQSARSLITTRRTYNRPLNVAGTEFETWEDTVSRVVYGHYQCLWEKQVGRSLKPQEMDQLKEAEHLFLDRIALPGGRILWLGGTEQAKEVPACLFNCAFSVAETVHDIVDLFWLLLNGTGTGFEPVTGSLFGFASQIEDIEVIPSTRDKYWRGADSNHETFDRFSGVWHIRCGDSARAWAKFVGKLIAGKHRHCKKLVLDFSDVRGPGGRLRGYGWICHGYQPFATACLAIVDILNQQSGRMLRGPDIHNIINHLGTVLSTRRSAQIAICPHDADWASEFISFKDDLGTHPHRAQSNNALSVDFFEEAVRPLTRMFEGGKGEPGVRNRREALRRAAWSRGTNPCAEILLPNKGFCNLTEINISHPRIQSDPDFAQRVFELIGFFNYLNTCVDMRDGILQSTWHENNQNLRLCGVGVTGIGQLGNFYDAFIKMKMKMWAWVGATNAAKEFGTPNSQAVTTIKPSGTLSKVMDCSEGIHKPLGEYIFNRMSFSKDDPLLPLLERANYVIEDHPIDPNGKLVVLPVRFEGASDEVETAIQQLERYRLWMADYVDHNASCSIYYQQKEVPAILDWLETHWDSVVALSFFPRDDAEYAYLPQTVVSKQEFESYEASLKPIDLQHVGRMYDDIELEQECDGGACPIR